MAAARLDRWEPLSVEELAGCPAPWWFAGGHALELHLGRSWRSHHDIDVGIRRCDGVAVLSHLVRRGWDAVVAAGGAIRPWDGGPLDGAAQENNVWCRRPGGPWQLDVTVGAGDDCWVYRRDPSIRRAWSRAVVERGGLRWLAPELQLLFKSDSVRARDDDDAHQVIPTLSPGGLALLRAQLRAGHPWRPLVDERAAPCRAPAVLVVLDLLASAGVAAWVDGGWAVDALLGRETRRHGDLDLAVRSADFAPALATLADHGYEIVRHDGPHNQVVADDRGCAVDVHAFDPTVIEVGPDGVARHGGSGLAYEAGGFSGRGTIGGRAVACISPDTLVRYHTGYAVDADDWHDVRLVCERFGLPIPPDYERFR